MLLLLLASSLLRANAGAELSEREAARAEATQGQRFESPHFVAYAFSRAAASAFAFALERPYGFVREKPPCHDELT